MLRDKEHGIAKMSPSSSGVESPSECPICKGVGFFRKDVPIDHPDFGKAFPCPHKLVSLAKNQLVELHESAGLGSLAQMTFDSFLPRGIGLLPDKQENLLGAFESVHEFAKNPLGWLVIRGGYGCGKTHLTAAIANYRVATGQPALFVVVPDLLDHIRATFAPDSNVSFDERFEAIRTAPLLLLDDFGTQNATPWAKEKVFQLINYRYNAKLPTVITTNLALEEIEPRLRSRMTDTSLSNIVTITAPDFRQGGTGNKLSSLVLYDRMTFHTFDLQRYELSLEERENLRRAFEHALTYAEHPKGWFVLAGPHGAGKTHLAASIANYREEKHRAVEFVLVHDLLDHLRATFEPNSSISFDRAFEDIRSAPFLIFDDLTTEYSSPWAKEKLFQIINYRYLVQLPTVFTIAKDTKMEERIRVRLLDRRISDVFEIIAKGYHFHEMVPELGKEEPKGKPRGSRTR